MRMLLTVKKGQQISREAVLGRLVDMLYGRNDMDFARGKFRVRGDVVEVYPGERRRRSDSASNFSAMKSIAITRFDPLTGHAHEQLSVITLYPAKQFVTPGGQVESRARFDSRTNSITASSSSNRRASLLEAQRMKMRTEYDLEMMQEMGFCNGIENYSRHLSGRAARLEAIHAARFLPEGLPARDR